MAVVLIVSSVLVAWVLQGVGVSRHEFGIMLRTDKPAEPFDGDGPSREVRCIRDVSAA